MLIYHAELTLEEGFDVLAKGKESRLVKGKRVGAASGLLLYQSLRGTPIRCYNCGIEACKWIAEKGKTDVQGSPVLNLYAERQGKHGAINELMTRDHIIPKSLGGKDDVGNLRPACSKCNGLRGNQINFEDYLFYKKNPQLVSKSRYESGLAHALKTVTSAKTAEQVIATLVPFVLVKDDKFLHKLIDNFYAI